MWDPHVRVIFNLSTSLSERAPPQSALAYLSAPSISGGGCAGVCMAAAAPKAPVGSTDEVHRIRATPPATVSHRWTSGRAPTPLAVGPTSQPPPTTKPATALLVVVDPRTRFSPEQGTTGERGAVAAALVSFARGSGSGGPTSFS
jgi:hypothetical protein